MSEKILIGKIVGAFGIAGELKVYNYAESPDRYGQLSRVFVAGEWRKIAGARTQKNVVLLRLLGIDSRNDAELLRGKNVYMEEAELSELPEDEHYIRDLIGLDVYDETSGEVVGTLKDILTDRAQPVYVVKTETGKELLIPGVPVFVKNIDEAEGRITVALIEGMMP